MISGILHPMNWMGLAKVLVKAEFHHFHFVIARYFYPSVAISYAACNITLNDENGILMLERSEASGEEAATNPPINLDYFGQQDYIKANRPAKPLPSGMRNMAGILFSTMNLSSLRHCEILSLPKQSQIIIVQPEPGLFQRFALKPQNVSSFLEWVCRNAWLPIQIIEVAHEGMRQISAVDPRFAAMMGVPAGRDIGMCWGVQL